MLKSSGPGPEQSAVHNTHVTACRTMCSYCSQTGAVGDDIGGASCLSCVVSVRQVQDCRRVCPASALGLTWDMLTVEAFVMTDSCQGLQVYKTEY